MQGSLSLARLNPRMCISTSLLCLRFSSLSKLLSPKLSARCRETVWDPARPVSKGTYVQRISQYRSELLRKQEKNILVPTVSPGSCFLVADTGVTAVTAEPNLPGLLSGTDLSFRVIRSNTRPLAFSRYVSPMYI